MAESAPVTSDIHMPGSVPHLIYWTQQCNELLNHKKEWNHAICSNMDANTDYHTKWNKSDREREISSDITYMWSLKNDTDEHIYKTEIKLQT